VVGAVAAAHTIPRELRALNDYGPHADRLAEIPAPMLLLVGEQTDPHRRDLFPRMPTIWAR